MPRNRLISRLPLAALALAGVPGVAHADEPIVAPTARGLLVFQATDPDAPETSARVPSIAHAKDQGPGVSGPWTLSKAVIVRAGSAAVVEAGIIGLQVGGGAGQARGLPAGVTVETLGSVPGYYIVRTPTVRRAAEMATSLWTTGAYESVEIAAMPPKVLRGGPTGDLLGDQWHLNNTVNPVADINAQEAWDLGYSGAGIVVGIIEGSFQYDALFPQRMLAHPDLGPNMVPEAATEPSTFVSDHATSVAGVVAARGDTSLGGAGLAYNAGIASQVYGDLERTLEALTFKLNLTDIKNNSWGIEETPSPKYLPEVLADALEHVAKHGRHQLGTIIVWAAGNGGPNDRVEFDPWASSRFTIAVGAIGDNDAEVWYSEPGSSLFVVTHSDGGVRGITTTDRTGPAGYAPGDFTDSFGGTSSAAPLAAGAIALALEANPTLTYRDVLHLLADTARRCDPADASWTVNGAGRYVSEKFGFGAIDAGALVRTAETATLVTQEYELSSQAVVFNQALPDNDPVGLTFEVPVPDGVTIETVELKINAASTFVGDVAISMTSPTGTESVFAHTRNDSSPGYDDFVFTSFRHWDEPSGGVWTIHMADQGRADITTIEDLTITVYGTRCPDFNDDGVLDFGDIGVFVGLFLAQDAGADFNGDGFVDQHDLLLFLETFTAGC